MDDFDGRVLARLPLAEAVLRSMSYVLAEADLGRLFEENRGKCYERELTFVAMVNLLGDALTANGGSGRQAFERARERGNMPVSNASAYDKLKRLPVAVSQALLLHAATRLAPLMPQKQARLLPVSLQSFKVIVVDGKTIKHVAQRVKGVRDLKAKLSGGKMAVARDMETGLALGFCADENGEANEVPLTWQLVPQIQASFGGVILWVADRQFCDLKLPAWLVQQGGHFLVRHGQNVPFFPDAEPARPFKDKQGRSGFEEWGWLGSPSNPRRFRVRRITIERADGSAVSVITDLIDAKQFPAADLMEVYLMRWGIERMFQQVTEVFSLRQLIGSMPRAMIFQAAFCLVLYDLIQVIKAYAAQDARLKVEEVSGEKLFRDVKDELTSWKRLSSPESTPKLAVSWTPQEMRECLMKLLKGRWTELWRKAGL